MAEELKKDETKTGDDNQHKEEKSDNKTFTQAELDTIIADRLTRVKKDMPTKEELTAFKTWQETQKTETEKQAEKLKELDDLKAALKARDYQDKVRDSNVNPKFTKFIVSEISASLKDGDDFDASLKAYLVANPEFVATTETKQNTPTGQRQGTVIKTKTEQEAYLEQKYGKNPYFKK